MVIGIDSSRAFGKDRTGTENYSYHLINEMLRLPASAKHKFVLFIRPGAFIPEWAGRSNVEVREIPFRYLWTQAGLAAATWREKLDVLWIPAHTLPVFRKPSLTTVVTIHGLEYKWLPEYNNLLQRWYLPLSTYYAARYATRLICVSNSTKKQLIRETAIDPDKASVIHEGVTSGKSKDKHNKAEDTRLLRKWGIAPERYILFVGTVQPRKNLPALITAYAKVKEKLPEVKLVIAGAKGWNTEEIYRKAGEEGVQDSVIFTGRVSGEELSALYRLAKVYVQPSLQEGFGLPILESMGAGVPVVTSDGGALPEVAGEAAIVVSLNNSFADRLAEQIERVITDEKLWQKLSVAGRARAAGFTWQEAAEATFKAIVRS